MFHQNGSAGRRNRLETEGGRGLHAAAASAGGTDPLRRGEALLAERSVFTKS